ncbi:MAG: arylsulfatase [Akkermansiaceae bacterium]|nr:arylsulfatase [Akkermansiaceae bacterium]
MSFPRPPIFPTAACLLLSLLAVNITTAEQAKVTSSKPNIVILYADDLGYGDLKCYNPDSKIPTPHLDKLAAEGMRFTDGHSSSGICTPSRYALLTGRHHWRKFYGIVNAFGSSVFSPERLTIPEMLQDKGYATACIGKWHLGWDWDAIRKPAAAKKSDRVESFDWSKAIPDGPLAHGFDYYFGDTVINFPPYAWIENDRLVKAPDTMMDTRKWKKIKEGRWECRPGPMCSDWDPYENIPMTTRKGVEFIKKHAAGDQPFFLYFAYPSPHAPIIPNDRFDGKSGAGPYGDFVVETDDSVGQLLTALESAGIADNTIVIFTADNGPEHYAYERDKKFGHWSAHPLRGLKRDIYEGGHRVPYIVRWPGKVPAGSSSDGLVSQIDIMASLASVVGYDLPDTAAEDSHDLHALWTGAANTSPRQTHIHNTQGHAFAIRHGDWTLVQRKNGYHSKGYQHWEKKRDYPADEGSEAQLFNISKDIGQRTNLIDQHPEKAGELATLLEKIQKQGHSAPRLLDHSGKKKN